MADETLGVRTDDIPHPLADQVGQATDGTRWVATETRSRVVHLSAARMNLLAIAARDDRRAVLISDELSSLTPAFSQIWQQSGGSWVVRQNDGGLRNGYGGRRIDRIEQAWTEPLPRGVDDFSVGFLRPPGADILQISTIVGLRHPARESTLLGEPMDQLNALVLDGRALAWGANEPVGEPWNRRRVTDAIQAEMPRLTTVVAAGRNVSATIAAQRTRFGVEEMEHIVTGIGTPGPAALARVRARLADVLRRVAETGMPLVGIQLLRPGRRDLTVPPYLLPPPAPLTLFIGAPAVRSFGLDVALMQDRHHAEVVGRPRLPALLFDLGPAGYESWQRLDQILGGLNPALLEAALGMGAGSLAEIRDQSPHSPHSDLEADGGDNACDRDLVLLETVKTHRARLVSAFLSGELAERRVINDNVRRLVGGIVLAAVFCAGCVGFSFVSAQLGKQSEQQKQQQGLGPATGPVFASDTFDRTLATGWGPADRGGRWQLAGPASSYAVADGAGVIKLSGTSQSGTSQSGTGADRGGYLPGLEQDHSDVAVTVEAEPVVAAGSSVTVELLGRRVSSSQDYRAVVHLTQGGGTSIALVRISADQVDSRVEQISNTVSTPGSSDAGDQPTPVSIRMQVVGTNPTTVRAKVWTGGTEPQGWTVTGSDGTQDLQRPGTIGLLAAGTSPSGKPSNLTVDDLIARTAP